MNLSDEIRKQIEKNKGLKLAVGEINNHLSILENLVRKDIMEQVDEAYQKGLEDGKKAFDFYDYTPNEAIEKLKAFEQKQDKIEVRDEVVWTEDENVVIVVTSIYTTDNMEWCDGFCKDGKVYSILTENVHKTGRHFDIASILEEMRHD